MIEWGNAALTSSPPSRCQMPDSADHDAIQRRRSVRSMDATLRDKIQSCVEVPDGLLRRPISEDVAEVELSRSSDPLWIDSQPTSVPTVEHVFVMKVAMEKYGGVVCSRSRPAITLT